MGDRDLKFPRFLEPSYLVWDQRPGSSGTLPPVNPTFEANCPFFILCAIRFFSNII